MSLEPLRIDCPHEPGQWVCDDCLDVLYRQAASLSAEHGLPDLHNMSERERDYAVLIRWRTYVKHGNAIADLLDLERQASWWIDNRTVLQRGAMNGKLGALLERARLRANSPMEAQRLELVEQLDAAITDMAKQERLAQAHYERTIAPYVEAVDRCRTALSAFNSLHEPVA